MNTEIIKIQPGDGPVSEEDDAKLKAAGEILRRGGLVAFPTETVYGLGGDALNPTSSKRIYAAKGRPSDNPLIVHIYRFEDIYKITGDVPEEARRIADAFWPGPLTMILPKSDAVPYETTGGLDTVAIRMPSHPAAQKLVYRMKGRDGIILITDSLRACLLPDGESELGGQKVFVKNGEARLEDGTLAGSIAAMNQVVLNFLVNSGAPLPEAVGMATVNPAKDLGVYDRIGSLEKGKLADIAILDSTDFHVKQTLVGGELVYNEEQEQAQ